MVAHAKGEELVVDVVHVGQEGVFAVAKAVNHHADYVEAWNHNEREGYDERVRYAHAFARLPCARHAELHGKSADDKADGLAAAIAHEDFAPPLGTAENVEVEEGQERAETGKGDGGVGVEARTHEKAAHEEEGDDAKT